MTNTDDRVAVASMMSTDIGQVYIAPNGDAFLMSRTGERRNGMVVSDPILSDGEREKIGLPRKDRP